MKKESLENKNGIKIKRVWFCNDIKTIKNNCDIVFLYGYNEKTDKGNCRLQYSSLIDLTKSEDELFNSIKKNVRYEINRSIKEKINNIIFTSKELKNNKEEILNFEKKYNQLYKEKGINTRLNIQTVKKYIENNMFILTKAQLGKDDLCYHAYVINGEKTRLLYSCSNFRNNDKETKNLIARANKFLHWEDIKYFKLNNYLIYDFGGITSFEKPNGIDKFKLSFSGSKTKYFNIVYANTLKGKCALFLKKILRK